LDLRNALHKATDQQARTEAREVPIASPEGPRLVNLIVEPVAAKDGPQTLLVLFQDAGPATQAAPLPVSDSDDEHVQRLEADLRLTKERLQATIEELESTNEELKSSNEEYQSIN